LPILIHNLIIITVNVFIDYKTEDFTSIAKDMDLVLSLVGGNIQEKSYSVLKEGGRLVSTTGPILKEIAQKHQVTGIAMVIKQSADDLQLISELINSEKIKTDVTVVYLLENAATGWNLLLKTDPALPELTHGKIVLEVEKEM